MVPGIQKGKRGAFTLVELLVAIAIIALVVSVSLPAMSRALAAGRLAGCRNNLRQVGLAALSYVAEHQRYPSAWAGPEQRWMDTLKPYLAKQCAVYRCPEDRVAMPLPWDPEITMSYGMNCFRFTDPEHCFWYGVPVSHVRRPSSVILFADCTPGKYYCGGGSRFFEPVVDVDYRHAGRFTAAYADGRVETCRSTVQADWDMAQ